MRHYTTELSLEDFSKIHPEIMKDLGDKPEELLPMAIAIHDDYNNGGGYYSTYNEYKEPYLKYFKVKHVYITRDYFEIQKESTRLKVKKKETKSLYFIPLD